MKHGFHTRTHRWSTQPSAHDAGWIPLPDSLQARVVTDPDTLTEATRDLGHQHHQTPGLLLRPQSTHDVATAVRFAAEHGVPGVIARGTRHATGGQSLGTHDGALYLDMRALDQIQVEATHVTLGAGATLRAAAEAAWTHGLRLTSGVTGYAGLTVGGVLSAGGWSLDHVTGTVGDYADELEIVDGTGTIHTCSPSNNPELHRWTLGGLGQFGIITRAKLRLQPARPYASFRVLRGMDHAQMLRAARSLIRRGQLNSVYGRRRGDDPSWEILATAYHHRNDDPMPDMLRGAPDPRAHAGDVQLYIDQVLSHDVDLYDPLIDQGWAQLPKRWWDYFLSDTTISGFLAAAHASEPRGVFGETAVALAMPKFRQAVRTGLRLPAPCGRNPGELVWLADGLLDPGLASSCNLNQWSRAAENWIAHLTEEAAHGGATIYHIGNVKHSMQAHYQRATDHVTALRAEYDPSGLFGRGLWRTTEKPATTAQPAPHHA
ncbi:FAD-binding protein [Saccharopolyspora sp. ID03-671]|uniref:FAD-binding oxidoreductase n=1 Tax=Saccharopolyspora sp. ID03-671 TaxID=3073066 RepID=UPI003254D287